MAAGRETMKKGYDRWERRGCWGTSRGRDRAGEEMRRDVNDPTIRQHKRNPGGRGEPFLGGERRGLSWVASTIEGHNCLYVLPVVC